MPRRAQEYCQKGSIAVRFLPKGVSCARCFATGLATSIENDALRVTVLHEGGHIAEILDKRTGINPLWIPPWTSIEPSTYDTARHPEYGEGADASLLAGIMGHNLCLDIFGGPSTDEAAAGLPVHGEVSTPGSPSMRTTVRSP